MIYGTGRVREDTEAGPEEDLVNHCAWRWKAGDWRGIRKNVSSYVTMDLVSMRCAKNVQSLFAKEVRKLIL